MSKSQIAGYFWYLLLNFTKNDKRPEDPVLFSSVDGMLLFLVFGAMEGKSFFSPPFNGPHSDFGSTSSFSKDGV